MFTVSPVSCETAVGALSGRERVVLYSGGDVLLCTDGGSFRIPTAEEARSLLPRDGVLLAVGRLDGDHCCGGPLAAAASPPEAPAGMAFVPTRAAFAASGADLMNAVSRVREMSSWRRQHRLCGCCGAPLAFSETDVALACPRCGERYYPQIAPAVIVAVSRNGGRELLLAHNRRFSGRTFSLIAGFVEAGESVEQAVRRELAEETGIAVKDIRYLSSQPWPFPNSLMLAFSAEWESGEARPDGVELSELGWFTRETLPGIPAPGSIAHRVITGFFNL